MIGEDAFLAQSIRMDVTGRGGWFLNKRVRFGNFRTDKFDLGFQKIDESGGKSWWQRMVSEDAPEKEVVARNGFSFAQFDSSGSSAGVRLSAQRKYTVTRSGKSASTVKFLEDRFEIRITHGNWTRNLVFPKGMRPGPSAAFELEGDTLQLVNERKRDADRRICFDGVIYKRGSETVGAVNLYGNGAVWLRNDLGKDQALALAALSTALLVRPTYEAGE